MATNLPLSDKQLISTYIQAKDTNRPVYMPQAFADDARLVMKVDTDAISFPPRTEGCDAISQVLVRNFGQTWDNVFTWCIEDSVELSATETVCQWLVCMTEKSSGEIRLGCGRYRWQFSGEGDQRRVSQLTIEIDQMNVLAATLHAEVYPGAIQLNWPWCTRSEALKQLPALSELTAF